VQLHFAFFSGGNLEKFDVEKIFHNESRLEMIDVSNNAIDELRPHSFVGQDKVRMLNLEFNKLERIEANTFDGLESLKRLSLRGSNRKRIGNLEGDAFKGLESLEYLNLADNNISSLVVDTFAGFDSLRGLELRYSHVRQFEDGCFDGVADSLEWIHLGIMTLDTEEDLNTYTGYVYGILSGLKVIYVNGKNLTDSNPLFVEWKSRIGANNGLPFKFAERYCQVRRGDLVSITSDAEQAAVYRRLNLDGRLDDGQGVGFWTGAYINKTAIESDGLTRYGEPNAGGWLDGSDWTYVGERAKRVSRENENNEERTTETRS